MRPVVTPPEKSLALPMRSDSVLKRLRSRRSNLVKGMVPDKEGRFGPNAETLSDILTIAARVPDHRKLTPWRFIVFEGAARAEFDQHIGRVFKTENPDMPEDRVTFEACRLQRASLVIAVISSPKDCVRGTPKWEQELSCGAVCQNLLLAAQAHGFAAQWLTEWYAYHAEINAVLGLGTFERVAGYIYIGHTDAVPLPRTRPDINTLVQNFGTKLAGSKRPDGSRKSET